MATQVSSDSTLRRNLKQRHISLIAIGGTIGAGLFVGSGVVIHDTGPAAIISFLLAGVLAVLVMRMLGEMAVARPAVGSFYEYGRLALGHRGGFAIGWLYWYFWVIVVAVESTAGAAILHAWLPAVPLWLLSLGLMVLMTLTNLASVRSYGEFEYWFSSIKVVAICAFIAVGLIFIIGLWPGSHASVANLTQHGGFFAQGIGTAFSGVVPAIAFFTGAEIATIAAAESREPARSVAKATNSVVLRVLLFYVGSIFIVVVIRPWNSNSVLASPYVSALHTIGIRGAGTVMQVIILTAVLSSLNSGLYTTSRILFALTSRGDAPQAFTKLTRRGVPARAILLGTIVGYISAIMSYLSPTAVFAFLIHSYGAVALFVYLLIAVSQLRLRARLQRESPEDLQLKMWFYPYLSWVTIIGMGIVIVAMGFIQSTRLDFLISLLTVVVVLCAYELQRRVGRARRDTGNLAAAPVLRGTHEATGNVLGRAQAVSDDTGDAPAS